MTFLSMEMLWLLLAIPLLVLAYLWLMRRKKKTALRYSNLGLVKQAMGKGIGWRRHVPAALLLIALTVLILAVARPAATITLASNRATVILAMDVSGSMRATDVEPNRLAAAQEAATNFIQRQPADVEVGIVAFAASALLVQPPTLDRDALYSAINSFDLRRATAVGAGILVSLATIFPDEPFDIDGLGDPRGQLGMPSPDSLMGGGMGAMGGVGLNPNSGRPLGMGEPQAAPGHVPVEPGSYQNAVVILLTDGATTTGPDPIAAGRLAAEYGVRVYTVGFGSKEGQIVDFGGRYMRAQLDEETLQRIAEATRAEYFAAQSAEALSEVYTSLASRLVPETRLTEISFIFAGVGAALAALAAGLSMAWLGRIA